MLATSDVDHSTAQLIYTITSSTSNGTIAFGGVSLGVNDTFSQADIDAGFITYDHNGSETSSDSFSFTVDDGTGTTTSATFNITITPVNDNTPIITSNGGGNTANLNVSETVTMVTTVSATDADLPTPSLTYSISGGSTLQTSKSWREPVS